MNKLVELELMELEEMDFESMEQEEKEVKGLFIKDLSTANWTFRKFKAMEEKEKEIKGLALEEIKRIKEWEEEELKGLNKDKEFFINQLHTYFKLEREKDKKFKLSTPYGNFYTRTNKEKVVIADEDEVIKILKDEGLESVIQVKETISKKEFDNLVTIKNGLVILKETGEVLESCKVEPETETKIIKLK